jgi:hypothetical protein
MQTRIFIFKITFILSSFLGLESIAQQTGNPQTVLPTKTLAETLGLPESTKTAPPATKVSTTMNVKSPEALNSNLDLPVLKPSSGTIVIEKNSAEIEQTSHTQCDCEHCQSKNDCESCSQGSCSITKRRGHKHRGGYGFSRGAYLSLVYVHSRWSDFTSALDDGSLGFEIGTMRELFSGFEGGLGLGWFSGVPDTASGQNQYYSFYVSGKTNWEILETKLTPTAGLDLSLGAYKVWAVAAESGSEITYAKLSSGTLIGLTPHLGLRMNLSKHTKIDLSVGYAGFFDSPQWRIGGWQTALTLGIQR